MFKHVITILMLLLMLFGCDSSELVQEPAVATATIDSPPESSLASTSTHTPAPSPTPIPPAATPTDTPLPPSPTPSPTPAAQTYTVQPNDTLLGIALEYGLTVEALAAANDLNEEDFLQLGKTLLIPTLEGNEVDEDNVENSVSSELDDQETIETAGDIAEANTATAPPAPPPAPAYSGPPLPDISHSANINPLTGLPVDDPAVLQRRPLIVRIGNDTGARQSQVGLNQADVVYEEIAEWWVTRFSAIFLAETPNTISPVRSARLINVQLAPQYQAALAHSGGSDPVRWEISQAPITNLDEFYNPAPYFYRPNQGWQTRLAIDAAAARDYMNSQGVDAPVTQQGFVFSDAPQGGEPAPDIYIPYPQATSFTEWHYDADSGQYLRWINGSPLIDAGDGQQVTAANVIIYFAPHQATDIIEDANGATSIRILINNVGSAWFFRDGLLTRGVWQTDGTRAPYFTKEDGSAYTLKPGNTWVEVVPTYYTIGLNSADEASSR